MAIQQGYLFMKNRRNKKNKDRNLQKIRLTCNKEQKFKA